MRVQQNAGRSNIKPYGRRASTDSDARFHLIARALADPRRYNLLRKIGWAGDTLACENLRTAPKSAPPPSPTT